MRHSFFYLSVAAVALLALPLTAQAASVGGGPDKPSAAQPGKPQALPLPKGMPHRPVGIAALAVKPGAKPPFTIADVAAYIAKHNLPMNSGAARDISVAALDFITAKDASARLGGAQTGLLDSDIVGFATLKGRMVFTGPAGAQGGTFQRGYAIFDAVNGNLLMVGSL